MKITRVVVTTSLFALFVVAAHAAGPKHRSDQASGTAEQVEAGKAKFAMCAGCHGTEGEGRVGMAPRLNSSSYLTVVSNELLTKTISDGRAGTTMIGWKASMSEDDITNLVSYVRSWQDKDGIELDSSPLKGDTATGKKLYREICSTCHGRSGAGYQEAGSGTGIGRKGFLDQASDAEMRGVISLGKDNTAMRPFSNKSPVAVADLTETQIDSIIKYLRESAW